MRKLIWKFVLWFWLLGNASANFKPEYLTGSYEGCKQGLKKPTIEPAPPVDMIPDDTNKTIKLVYKGRFETEVKLYFFNAQYKIKVRYYDSNYSGLERVETLDLNPNLDPDISNAESLKNDAESQCQTILEKLDKYPFGQPHDVILTTIAFKSKFVSQIQESDIGLTVEEPEGQLTEDADVEAANDKYRFEQQDKAIRSAIVILRNANKDHVATVVFSKSEFMLIEVFIQVHGISIKRVLSTDIIDNRYETYLTELIDSIKQAMKSQELISKAELTTTVFEALNLFSCEIPESAITLKHGIILLHFNNKAEVVQTPGLADKLQKKAQEIMASKLVAVENKNQKNELDPDIDGVQAEQPPQHVESESEFPATNNSEDDFNTTINQDDEKLKKEQENLLMEEKNDENAELNGTGEEGNDNTGERILTQKSLQQKATKILNEQKNSLSKVENTTRTFTHNEFDYAKAFFSSSDIFQEEKRNQFDNKIISESRKLFVEPFDIEVPECPFKNIKFGLNQFNHVSFPFIQVRIKSDEQGLEPVVLEYFLHSPSKEVFAIKLHELLFQLSSKFWLLRESAKNPATNKKDSSEIALSDFENTIKTAIKERSDAINMTWEAQETSADALFNGQLAIQITKKIGLNNEPAKWSIWFFKFPDLDVYKHLHYELSISARRGDDQFPIFVADVQNFVKTFGTVKTKETSELK